MMSCLQALLCSLLGLVSADRCYYDPLQPGCPATLTIDMQRALCSCEYSDNTWINVLSNFIWAFQLGPSERPALAQRFNARMEPGGLVSLDVGYSSRISCGETLAGVYPGTEIETDAKELHEFASNFIFPEVRKKLIEICLPGRIALQLLCLHASLYGLGDASTARAYASRAASLLPMVQGCVEDQTPWPFPGLGEYLHSWESAQLPSGRLAPDAAAQLAWFPSKMRGKRPEESEAHYWPCAPLADAACFPPNTENLYMSCENCCDPGKGPMGEEACFVGEFTFARCCRTPGGSGRFY